MGRAATAAAPDVEDSFRAWLTQSPPAEDRRIDPRPASELAEIDSAISCLERLHGGGLLLQPTDSCIDMAAQFTRLRGWDIPADFRWAYASKRGLIDDHLKVIVRTAVDMVNSLGFRRRRDASSTLRGDILFLRGYPLAGISLDGPRLALAYHRGKLVRLTHPGIIAAWDTRWRRADSKLPLKAIAAFLAKDRDALHRALGLKNWEASPLDVAFDKMPVEDPTDFFAKLKAKTWPKALQLRKQLEAGRTVCG